MTEPAHLSSGEIRRILGYLPLREQVFLVHVADCPACQQAVRRQLSPQPAARAPFSAAAADYAEVWAGLEAGLAEATERVAAERQAAEALVGELLATPARERSARIRHEARFRTVSVAYLLFERSLAASAANAREAESLALLGIFLLGRLDPESAPRLLVHELRARGWALAANARWLAGDWPALREAIESADQALAEAGYVVKRPGIRRLVAAIRLTERQAEEVFELAGRAVHLLLRALVGETPAGRPAPEPAAAGDEDD